MATLAIIAAGLIMGFVGIYLSWLTDHRQGIGLGPHRISLAFLPTLAAALVCVATPDQTLVACIGYGLWAVATWIGGFAYSRARRDSAPLYSAIMWQSFSWLGIGLALGSVVAGLITWQVS